MFRLTDHCGLLARAVPVLAVATACALSSHADPVPTIGFRQADSLARLRLAAFDARTLPDSIAALDAIDTAFEAIAPYRPAVPDSFLALARRAAALRAQSAGESDLVTRGARVRLALLLADNGKAEEARSVVRDGWAGFAPDPALRADAAYALGRAEHFIGDGEHIVRSESLLVAASALRAHTLGADHPRTAMAYEALGRTLVRQRKFAAAESSFARANAGLDAYDGGPAEQRAQAEVWRGNYLFQQEAHTLARTHYEVALAIRERTLSPDDPTLARSIGLVANTANRLGDIERAQTLYRRADAILTRADSTSRATLLNRINFSGLLTTLGDDEEAIALLTNVLAHPERLSTSPQLLANAHSNLANALAASDRAAFALPHFAFADSINKTLPVSMNRIRTLSNWGKSLGMLGRYDEAVAHFNEALAIAEREIPEGSALTALVLDDLADLHCLRGEFAAARPLVERSLAYRDSVFSRSHPLTANCRLVLARVERGEGHPARAAEIALDVERTSVAMTRLTSRALAEREALAFARVRPMGLPLVLDMLRTGELRDSTWLVRAWEATAAQRALVLDCMAERSRLSAASALAPGDSSAAWPEAARERYAHLLVSALLDQRSDIGAAELDSARRRSEDAERALAARLPAPGGSDTVAELSAGELLGALRPGSALVSFVCTARVKDPAAGEAALGYVAFVGRAGESTPRFVDLGPAATVDSLFAQWYERVRRGTDGASGKRDESAMRAAGKRLRARVLDPLLPHLNGASEIAWVPDGALQLLNVPALPAAHGNRYVVEESPLFRLLSTERDLVRDGAPSGAPPRMLAVGGVNYDRARRDGSGSPELIAYRDGERATRGRAGRFGPLPASLAEARDVTAAWQTGTGREGKAEVLSGAAADETDIRVAVAGCRVVHLSTHGFVLEARPPPRAHGGLSNRDLRKAPAGNPLELSGIALSGANDRATARTGASDGILTAQELAGLDLSRADWLVLSGCETGRGTALAGEGVLGMRRAGMTAGARTVIVSLWPVEDLTSRLWMRTLYEARFERGRPTAEAVRDASRKVLAERRRAGLSTSPATWGAFVAVGD